jgi:hypothetical protein
MIIRGVKRWSARVLKLGCLGAALALPATIQAQGPPGGPGGVKAENLPRKTYTKNTTFHLPVQMEERTRANLKEVCLYVKQGSADWVRQEAAAPSITHFTYRVPRDGEYWFSLVSVAKDGKSLPADVSKEPPQLRVVIDNAPPILEVEQASTPTGEFCLRCRALDANLSPGGLKVVSRTESGDRVWDPVPGMPGAFKLASQDLLNVPVRVSAVDLSGNSASKDVDLKTMVQANPVQRPAQETKSLSPTTKIDVGKAPPPLPRMDAVPLPETTKAEPLRTNIVLPTPPLPPLPNVNNPGPSVANSSPIRLDSDPLPAIPYAAPTTLPGAGQGSTPTVGTSPGTSTTLPTSYVPSVPTHTPSVTNPSTPGLPASGQPASNVAGQKLLLNTTRAVIDYRIDQVGPSGVGKVEVFLTHDQGQMWRKVCEDADRRSPVEVELPGEGLFGLKMVVSNGNGFGGRPPLRGEQPTCWVEVDTTSPLVQLRPSESLANDGHLDIRWTAQDKNLSPEPVHLFYRTRPDAPWQPIARNLKNDGLYRWAFPRDVGPQFFFKVEVADQAGNVGRAETQQPILLDMSEPRVQVVGITGMTNR